MRMAAEWAPVPLFSRSCRKTGAAIVLVNKMRPSLIERFEEKYIPEPNSGCWLWVGADNANGHGQMTIGNKRVYAHRFSYEYFCDKIPDGMEIDHLCRVRCCVNPIHLEPVTRSQNIKRSPIMCPAACPKGHEYTGKSFYLRKSGRKICKICARERYLLRYFPKRGGRFKQRMVF